MTRRGKIILVTAIVLALLVLVGMRKMRSGTAKEAEIQTVQTHVITPTILASGSLTYQTEIRMVSEVMGRVKELNVKEGDQVKQGDVLLRLDPATVQAQVDALEAGLRQSKLAIDRQRVAAETIETKWNRYQK